MGSAERLLRAGPGGEGAVSSAPAVLLIALAVAIDGFGVGIAYGLRHVRLGLQAMAILFTVPVLTVALGMTAGAWLLALLGSPAVGRALSGLILMALGVWIAQRAWRDHRRCRERAGAEGGPAAGARAPGAAEDAAAAPRPNRGVEAYWRILDEPTQADVDRSGTLDALEAGVLATALALDALGAGVSLGMMGGLQWAFAFAVGAAQLGVFLAGLGAGRFTAANSSRRVARAPLGYAAGAMVMLLGVLRLFS